MKVKTRGRFQLISPIHGTVNYQHLDMGGGKVINARLTGTPAPCTASITVGAVNPISIQGSVLTLGALELVEGVHWDIGINVNATATALATAIDNLNQFSAEVNGVTLNQVDITGADGPHQITFKQVDYTENLTLSPAGGVMSEGSPDRVGPDIT